MSVLDNLNRIKSCKEDIKQAIIDKGVDMTGVSLEGYATKISEIQSGGGSGDYLDMRENMSTYYSTAEKVGAGAFAYCSSLQSINLPMCSSVANYAFQTCSSLQSVNLPMCSYVGVSAFNYCKSLQSIDLPMCSSVGMNAFQTCSSLQSVNLPNCGYVEVNTFTRCSSLQSINLPMCSYIGGSAFQSCKSLSVLDIRSTYSCSLLNSKAFSSTPFASGIGSIYVHAAHLSQFQNATNWTYFSNCLVGVGDPTRPLLSFDSGRVYGDTYYLYSSNWKSYLGITSSSVISIDLPNVKVLSFCFSKFSNLIELSMEKLISAPIDMCSYCSSLQTVNLPMCSYVGSEAFYACSSLQTVNLPMCEYVGNIAFYACSSLQSIDLPICSYVGINAFNSCKSLQSIDLPMCSYVGSEAFHGCSSLQTVNLPMCEYIGNTALYTYNNTIDAVYIGTSISKVCQAGGAQIFANNVNIQGGGYFVNKIFVPMSLVDAYKSAQYWSDYASLIYGI